MATITDQIRDIVKESKVSRYAISKHTGISETLLGRFLTGERGLSLNSLDKLAEMFGIEATAGSQHLPRPAKRGRKPKKEEGKMSVTTLSRSQLQSTWKKLAFEAAMDAKENNFPSRRGVYALNDVPTSSGEVLCIYNNNPWGDFEDGVSKRRDDETAKFRSALKRIGIKELAYETYPLEGEEEAGYTFAMLIDATENEIPFVVQTMNKILREYHTNRSGE